jgi:hypothetical protein
VAILTILGGTVSLVVRYRHARRIERQQLRWVALAAALMGVTMMAVAVLVTAGELDLASWAAVLGVGLLPLAAASRRPWTAASTGAATTRPGSSRPSVLGCGTRSTWTP